MFGEGGARPGKLPDRPRSPPIELPRVVMRDALAVAACGVALALLLGLWRARADMREETAGALVLAQAMARLSQPVSQSQSREAVLAELSELPLGIRERHLRLQVRDLQGRALLPVPQETDLTAPMSWLVAASRALFPPPSAQTLSWPMQLADGERLQIELIASPDSEQHEALARLAELLALLLAGSALLLAVLNWHVRRSLRPLRSLLDAIAGLEQQRLAPLRALPAMPIRELDAIAAALRHLAGALEQAEGARRLLSRQVQTLQEDERHRIARELHDELGQHLTALRVDAAWLERRLAESPELAAVAGGMSEQCRRVQEALRALLTRLRPLALLGTDGLSTEDEAAVGGVPLETAARLRELLESLVDAWAQSPGLQTRYVLEFDASRMAQGALLPRELLLTLYRISQEALTNVARHARAERAVLRLSLASEAGHRPAGDDAPLALRGRVRWSVEDDGCGLETAAWQRGNGLAGVKERVWAAGGDLQWEPLRPGAPLPGLRLLAELHWSAGVAGGAERGEVAEVAEVAEMTGVLGVAGMAGVAGVGVSPRLVGAEPDRARSGASS